MKKPSVANCWMLIGCFVPLLMMALVACEQPASESADAPPVQEGANNESPEQSSPNTSTPSGDTAKAKKPSGQTKSLDWAEVIEAAPDPAVVTDAALRDAIVKTGLPWRVRDKGTEIEMVLIPPGEFVMGKSPGDKAGGDELPAHEVKLTNAFYLGRYEVTQQQYAKVMGNNPSQFSAAGSSVNDSMNDGLTRREAEQAAKQLGVGSLAEPVDSTTWEDCNAFCRKTKLRLPTEAEWEYACRAGQRTPRYGELDEIAWHAEDRWKRTPAGTPKYAHGTHAVGTKQPNALGLYDILGNVWEWVKDWYGDYSADDQTNPQGPSSGVFRVARGGAWDSDAHLVRSSVRKPFPPGNSYYGLGFRASRTP